MTFREIMKINVDLAPKVLSSLVVFSYLYTSIFAPEIQFTRTTLAKMCLVALACCLLTFVLYSRKELSRVKMRNRFILHCLLLAITVPGLLLYWNWIQRTVGHAIGAVVLVLLVYSLTMLYMYLRYKTVTDQINAVIRRNKN